jgi:hypothetical protein
LPIYELNIMSKNAKPEDYLAALRAGTANRKASTAAVVETTAPETSGSEFSSSLPTIAPPIPTSLTRIKPTTMNVYIYPEDRTRLGELTTYLLSQYGIKAADSAIVRAALSLVEKNRAFADAVVQTLQADGRRKDGRKLG